VITRTRARSWYRGPVRALLTLAVWAAVPTVASAATRTSSDDPYPGVHHEEWQDAGIPAVMHVLKIDLTSAEIQLVATKEADRGRTTTSAANTMGAVAAVNGDYFTVSGFHPAGLAMGDGALWSMSADTAASGFLAFSRVGERTYASISPPPEVIDGASLDPATQGVIGGRPLLLSAGAAPGTFDCGDPAAQACVRAPRTAVGLSADGNTLWLVVVDGWQQRSSGMTAAELAAFLKQLGVFDALALDGGSASSMVLGGGEIASPSDGVEAAVANHLGVRYGSLPKGTLVGFIREHDVFSGKDLPGATAKLDDGRAQTVGANAMFDFDNVTPRWACVTASLAGYHSAKRCVQVMPGIVNYDSIALEPNSKFIDAGANAPPDASPDARWIYDAPPGADGGNPANGDGAPMAPAGCCQTGGDSHGVALALAVLLVVRWRRRR
jgi:MYXO-CTERM domain-containing protein